MAIDIEVVSDEQSWNTFMFATSFTLCSGREGDFEGAVEGISWKWR